MRVSPAYPKYVYPGETMEGIARVLKPSLSANFPEARVEYLV